MADRSERTSGPGWEFLVIFVSLATALWILLGEVEGRLRSIDENLQQIVNEGTYLHVPTEGLDG